MPAYGTFQYDANQYNGAISSAVSYLTDLVVYNGFSLSDGVNAYVQNIEESMPAVEIIGGSAARDHGGYVVGSYYRKKVITVRGMVTRSTALLLEAYLDTVRQNLAGNQGTLDITRNGVVRRYVATPIGTENLFSERKYYHVTWCPFQIQFECRTPFATDRAYAATTLTTGVSPTTHSVYNAGTYLARPVITLIFNAASSVTAVNVNNQTTGEQIEYDPVSLAAGDAVVFDAEQMKMTHNGAVKKYSGTFPHLAVGTNSVLYTVTGTSFNLTATILWKGAYL